MSWCILVCIRTSGVLIMCSVDMLGIVLTVVVILGFGVGYWVRDIQDNYPR